MILSSFGKTRLAPFLAFFLAGAVIAFPKSKAWSACGLSVNAGNVNIGWTINFTHLAVSVQVSRSTEEACSYSLGITKGSAGSYDTRRVIDGAKTLRYQLYQDNGLTKILKDGADIVSLDEVVQGGFQAGAVPVSQTVNFYLEIPINLATTPALASAGTYSDTFTINAYESATPPFSDPVATKTITVTVTVPKMIALSLVDTGSVFQEGQTTKNVSFGTLKQGSSSAMDLVVRTNAGFTVTFSSANDGNLRHTTPAIPSLVPYSLYVNAVLLNLANSNAVPVLGLSGAGSTAMDGLAYPMKIVIGSVGGAGLVAGPHSDGVTITATTTE